MFSKVALIIREQSNHPRPCDDKSKTFSYSKSSREREKKEERCGMLQGDERKRCYAPDWLTFALCNIIQPSLILSSFIPFFSFTFFTLVRWKDKFVEGIERRRWRFRITNSVIQPSLLLFFFLHSFCNGPEWNSLVSTVISFYPHDLVFRSAPLKTITFHPL